MTREEKAELERVRRGIRGSEADLAYARTELAKNPGSQELMEEVEYEEYILALKRFCEHALTGTDPNDLVRPVRPPSVQQRAGKYRDRSG